MLERHEIDVALAYEVHERSRLLRVPLLEEEKLFVTVPGSALSRVASSTASRTVRPNGDAAARSAARVCIRSSTASRIWPDPGWIESLRQLAENSDHMDAQREPADQADTPRPTGNRYNIAEWAGAFGDLGTLIPFVVAYLTVMKLDATGVLVAFGAAMIATGIVYRTPVPVQPMKAIGAVAAAQAAQTAVITPASVHAAGLVTGVVWLLLGATNAATRISQAVPRHVVIAIVLGLGMAFMLEGIKMMAAQWIVAGVALALTMVLLGSRRIPAMFVILVLGVILGLWQQPELAQRIAATRVVFQLPHFAWPAIAWTDFVLGVLFLALPQLPMTVGNALIAIRQENNRLFPERALTERKVALSTGIMNVAGSAIGGVPMCHGAGGMAGHVAFGARTGGAVVILGVLLLAAGLFLGPSVELFLRILPAPLVGVILFVTGASLALGSCDFPKNKGERFVTLVTAAFTIYNVGIAFVVGIVGAWIARKGWLRL